MDRQLCLCSASLVLMLLCLGRCFARPSWMVPEDAVDEEVREEGGVLGEKLQMLKRMLEREEIQRALEDRREERMRMQQQMEEEQKKRGLMEEKLVERKQVEREMMEREEIQRALEERREERMRMQQQMEEEQKKRGLMEEKLVDRKQVERGMMERELIERQLEYERQDLRREKRRRFHAQQFLERFGYLPELPRNVSHDAPNIRRAIRDMQRMYHLNVTGDLDEMTIKMMQIPRCGMPDATPKEYLNISRTRSKSQQDLKTELIANNYYVPGYKWKKLHLSWKLTNYHQLLSSEVTKNALRSAFKFWSDVSGLTFTETNSEADIKMEFVWGTHQDGPGNAFDGPGGVLAHAFYPESGETHFDWEEQWTDGTTDGINLMIVAAHELGHALGLGHSNVQGALMAPYYQGYDPNFKLPRDDILAIQELYGGPIWNPPTEPTPLPLPTPVPQTPTYPQSTPAPVTTVKTTETTVTTTSPTTVESSSKSPYVPPNTCDMTYKAITQTHDYRIYIFNGQWMWRTSEYGLDQGFPLTISTYYESPPVDITAAIFSWKTYYTYFFKGKKVWRYYGFQLADKKTIETPGYPENPKVAIASKDSTILLIKAGNVWQFDEETLDVTDAFNPTPFNRVFPGAPSTFDSAVRLVGDQNIYFFRNQNYYKYNEEAHQTVESYPKTKAGPWMGPACGAEPYTPK